jgi:ribosome-binding protein aMBF1 (putative translation factor)
MPRAKNPKDRVRINRIKEVLAEQGRTQVWLSEKINKDPNTIASMCNNVTQPRLKDLKEIARLLNVNIKELLYDTPVK